MYHTTTVDTKCALDNSKSHVTLEMLKESELMVIHFNVLLHNM